jgi:hypothetical protein
MVHFHIRCHVASCSASRVEATTFLSIEATLPHTIRKCDRVDLMACFRAARTISEEAMMLRRGFGQEKWYGVWCL